MTERSQRLRAMARFRIALFNMPPAKLLLTGYVSYMLVGWMLLSLPVAQVEAVRAIDTLFIATSAVSTTGLVSVDPGGSFTFFGEVVILLLIQAGGLGYMTIGSFATLAIMGKLPGMRARATKHAFNLPDSIRPRQFIVSVVAFTLVVEVAGALALWALFAADGTPDALWMGIFHSVSAFCTAGFSLFPASFEGYEGHFALKLVLSVLSILGAMGFLIVVDGWRTLTGQARFLGFSSKVIVRMTLLFLAVGTLILFVVEPSLRGLSPEDRLMDAFFQTMTATTTVGFNTVPIGGIGGASLMVLFFLMVIGASPAGTGGGLKTTSFAALVGLVRSTLKGRDRVRYLKREVPPDRLQLATASLAYYFALAGAAMFLLLLTEAGAAFEVVMFEVISAMGTVGLSMGLTGGLSDLGKLVVVVLMTAGRVGILTFGIAVASHDESRAEEADNDLVL
ncbi:TrkH family potassium uptake protein [Roseobacter sp. HKCCA0434]|uniref:TrkH family potassium uptake protein n=1 Tax=Roseobacter sp. HKCCA0434 TaxID=3079297 RepID=UPI002905E4F0|nr:potassium transporter TrkG [Roseobacter sp. HKCCA0434]